MAKVHPEVVGGPRITNKSPAIAHRKDDLHMGFVPMSFLYEAVRKLLLQARMGCASWGKLSREKDSVGLWRARVETPLVCLALAAQNMGRTGPIPPPPPPMGEPWTALVIGALLWALVSVVVASESAKRGMRRRAWGWVASFLSASAVAAYAFGMFV